jgi:hypothetical protein
VEALVAALEFHQQDPEVQREACGALRALASKYPAGARRIVDNGGFMLCLHAITECPDEAVGDAACKALSAFQCAVETTFRPEGGTSDRSDTADGVAYQARALWEAKLRRECENGLQFCDCELRRRTDLHTMQAMLGAIYVFLENGSARAYGINLIDPVIACMEMCPGHMKVQVPACGILERLTMGHPSKEEAIHKVASSRGVGPICQAMKDLPHCTELMRPGISALRNIAAVSNINKTLAVKSGGIPTILTTMKLNPKNADLQELSIATLTSICDTLGRAGICARLGGVEAVVAALKRHAGTGRIAELGCIILCMFCDDDRLRQQVIRSGALAFAKTLSKTGPKDAQRWGYELLRELTENGSKGDQ